MKIHLSANQKKIAHAAIVGALFYLSDPANYASWHGLIRGLLGFVAARVAGALLATIDTKPNASP